MIGDVDVARWWNETVAALADMVPGGVPMLAFLSIVATLLFSLAWYFWPQWLPWRWRTRDGARRGSKRRRGDGASHRFRLGALRWRWRLRWRRRRRKPEPVPADLPPDELPDLPAEVLALTADQLAAAGRFAEAVRERLRAVVRDLIERDVIPPSPGWTVTELSAAAITARPALGPPLRAAVDLFSQIWYGLRPATADDDQRMRTHAGGVRAALAGVANLAAAAAGPNAGADR